MTLTENQSSFFRRSIHTNTERHGHKQNFPIITSKQVISLAWAKASNKPSLHCSDYRRIRPSAFIPRIHIPHAGTMQAKKAVGDSIVVGRKQDYRNGCFQLCFWHQVFEASGGQLCIWQTSAKQRGITGISNRWKYSYQQVFSTYARRMGNKASQFITAILKVQLQKANRCGSHATGELYICTGY